MEASLRPPSEAEAKALPSGGMGENEVQLKFAARSENVAFARTVAAVFASRLDFTLDELDELKLAVSEAVANCVLHAYPGGEGWVVVRLAAEDGRLWVEVADEGVGIEDPERARETGVTSRPGDCLGLGFTVMAEYMDSVAVESRVGGGTKVRMGKRPASRAHPPEDGGSGGPGPGSA